MGWFFPSILLSLPSVIWLIFSGVLIIVRLGCCIHSLSIFQWSWEFVLRLVQGLFYNLFVTLLGRRIEPMNNWCHFRCIILLQVWFLHFLIFYLLVYGVDFDEIRRGPNEHLIWPCLIFDWWEFRLNWLIFEQHNHLMLERFL